MSGRIAFLPMQAVVTKFLPPTNTKGSRVKARAAAGSVTLQWDHALNPAENHRAAAKALVERLGWLGAWYCGGLPDDAGYCFVCALFGPAGGSHAFTLRPEKRT